MKWCVPLVPACPLYASSLVLATAHVSWHFLSHSQVFLRYWPRGRFSVRYTLASVGVSKQALLPLFNVLWKTLRDTNKCTEIFGFSFCCCTNYIQPIRLQKNCVWQLEDQSSHFHIKCHYLAVWLTQYPAWLFCDHVLISTMSALLMEHKVRKCITVPSVAVWTSLEFPNSTVKIDPHSRMGLACTVLHRPCTYQVPTSIDLSPRLVLLPIFFPLYGYLPQDVVVFCVRVCMDLIVISPLGSCACLCNSVWWSRAACSEVTIADMICFVGEERLDNEEVRRKV